MIVGFRDEALRAFFVDDVRTRAIPADLEIRVFRKLQMIDDATSDQDLRVPPSNHFEKLRGGSMASIRSASTGSGGWCFGGMARGAKPRSFISMTIAIGEGAHADDQAQTGNHR